MEAKISSKLITVIVNGLKHAERLPDTLAALNHQTLPPAQYEVLVFSPSLKYSFEHSFNLSLVDSLNQQEDILYNQCIQNSSSEFLVFISSGGLPGENFLECHLKGLTNRPSHAAISIGPILYASPSNSASSSVESSSFQINEACEDKENENFCWKEFCLNNAAMDRKLILGIGGFQGEDQVEIELLSGYRLEQIGARIFYNADAVLKMNSVNSEADIFSKAFQRGQSSVVLWRQNPGMVGWLFDHFYTTSPRGIVLRRFFLAIGPPRGLLLLIKDLLRNGPWKRKWLIFLHSYWFWLGVQSEMADSRLFRRLTTGIPVLMYHAFGAKSEKSSRYVTPSRKFTLQMRLLQWMGYHTIHLNQILANLMNFQLPEEKSIVITIDDGYQDNFTVAYPILHRLGMTATIFLVAGRIGGSNNWDQDEVLTNRPLMTWDQIREMQADGFEFGAHSMTHPALPSISTEELWREVQESKVQLGTSLGVKMIPFAYPHGKYNQDVMEIVRQAGYTGACSVEKGLVVHGTNLFALKRTDIKGTFSISQFIKSVWFG